MPSFSVDGNDVFLPAKVSIRASQRPGIKNDVHKCLGIAVGGLGCSRLGSVMFCVCAWPDDSVALACSRGSRGKAPGISRPGVEAGECGAGGRVLVFVVVLIGGE